MGSIPVIGPWLLQLAGVNFFNVEETEFFISVVETALKDRLRRKDERNDLLKLMKEALKGDDSGWYTVRSRSSILAKSMRFPAYVVEGEDQFEKDAKLNGVEETKKPAPRMKKEVEDELLIATAMSFLTAGFETTAQALAFVVYHLAIDQGVQVYFCSNA